jgi:hypothetical protein
MATIEFTGNYQDLSTDKGYQFKFFCDKCGNGYMSSFRASAIGIASSAAQVAGSLFGGVFGFWEALRLPGDEGKERIPPEEWTVERLQRSGHLIAGTVDDVRRRLDEIVQRVNPEYLVYGPDQGISSFDE